VSRAGLQGSKGPTVWAALGEADGCGVEEHALRADVRGGAVPAVVRDRQLWTRKADPGGGWKWRLSESEGRKTLSGTMHTFGGKTENKLGDKTHSHS